MRCRQAGSGGARQPAYHALVWLLLCSFPLWAGCEGCVSREDDSATTGPVPESEYTFNGAQPLPLGQTLAQSGVKPGHWFTVVESLRSNRTDQRGVLRHSFEWLQAPPGDPALSPPQGTPLSAATERLPLYCERPAVLPKGRLRRLDARLLAGNPKTLRRGSRVFLGGQFLSSTHGTGLDTGRQSVALMQPQEYFFVILTKRPERFSWIQSADWLRLPVGDPEVSIDVPINYRLVIPKTEGLLALPETMLDWTSTAMLLWDDLEPAALTPEQQRAISDWIHFGGRLIVNGPAAGTELSRSWLAELLPQEVQGNARLEPTAIAELLRHWSVPGDPTVEQQIEQVLARDDRLATDGDIHPQATPIRDTAETVLLRQAGRGQVVLTRFDLTSDWLRGWRSRDSFVNAALLGRPGRSYSTVGNTVQQQYHAVPGGEINDIAFNTGVRLLARDGRLLGDSPLEFVVHPTQGMAGWRDDSDAATLAVQTLRAESGVEIPPRRFVLQALAAYLFVLVPLNYLLFRLLGRLEWAWIAVPAIGLIGAGWIARGAQLDIGFARSRTEIALVELHAGYPRGHVTRFTSLYNSLSRKYDMVFDSPDAVAAPLGILGQTPLADDQRDPVTLRYGYADGPILAGVQVASNRTQIFHAEQVVDFGGSVELQGDWLQNNSSLNLLDARMVRRTDAGQVQVAALGHCDAATRSRVRWSDAAVQWPSELPLQTEQLLKPLARGEALPAGATRLVARCEQPIPGMQITPEAAQQKFAAIVVVHLERPLSTVSEGDENLPPEQLATQNLLLEEDYSVEQ